MKTWNQNAIVLCLGILCAAAAACDNASGEGDEDAGPAPDADADTDSDTDGKPVQDAGPWELRCDPAGLDTGEQCSTQALCNCDNVCGANLFEASNEVPAAILNRFPNYSPDNFGVFLCYAQCDPASPACPNATDQCQTIGEGSVRESSLCIPTGKLVINEMPLKVYQAGLLKPADILTASTQIPKENIAVNEPGLPAVPNSVLAIHQVDEARETTRINITVTFGNPGDLWSLFIIIDGASWTPDAVLNIEDAGAAVSLWRTRTQTLWYEGPAVSGTATVKATQPDCETVADCPLSSLSLDLTLLLSRIGFKTR